MRLATALLNASLLVTAGGLAVWAAAPVVAQSGQDQGEAATEDVIYLNDGRILRGQIVEEKNDQVVFEYHDRNVNIRTKMTLSKDEISKIERDVAVKDAPQKAETKRPRRTSGATSRATSRPGSSDLVDERRTFGVRRAGAGHESVPSVYLVPMKGQMGTDVSSGVYEEMVDDIRTNNPDMLIMVMECIDQEDRMYSRIPEFDKGQHTIPFLDMYQELVRFFHEEVGDIKQGLWIHDSVGISSVVALSWRNIYMKPEARLGGARVAAAHFEAVKGDANMYGKFREAYMAIFRGFAAYGESAEVLMDAMIRPEYKLSASWKGRDVEWRLDETGEYIVDNSEKSPVSFTAKNAEDFMIIEGLAETLDDIALLVGHREYRVIDGKADDIFESHKEDWRRTADNCVEWLRDYQQFLGWANGEDTLKYLGQAKGRLEKVVAAIERYDAVKFRMQQMGVNKFALETQIEIMKEQIRAIRGNRRGGAGGGGGRGGFGGGG